MSDGGLESGRETELHHNSAKKKKPRSDDFVQAIAKFAVAQVCENAGFQGFQQSALDTLSDVAVRYIIDFGKTATFYANLAGRTECNMFDIIQGLEDLGLSQGFSGASEFNHCLAGSGAVREIEQYVGVSEEIPFAYLIPSFPITKDRKPTPNFAQAGETSPHEHIPSWLPAFPDSETYSCLPVGTEREMDEHVDKVEQAEGHRSVEQQSLPGMQWRLISNGPEAEAPAVDLGDAVKAKRAADENPFFTAPLAFGEKEVSSVVIPPKLADDNNMVQNCAYMTNHVSVLDTFFPAIEAVKSGLCDSEEGRKKVLLNRRSTVKFKLGIGRKTLDTTTSLRNEGTTKTNMKDDKKRRAEQILKDFMDNPQELAQL